jgi:hypothetical protein
MPAKVVISGFMLVVMAALLVFTVEFFLPLSAKSDMNVLCRSALLKMENEGGMSDSMKAGLKNELESRGFENILINGTANAKQGSELNLHIEAEYRYSRLVSLFTRTAFTQHMIYEKTAMSRKVIN